MLKADQIQYVALHAGILKSESERTLKQLGPMVRTALTGDDGKPKLGAKIKVDGLGTWEVVKTAARKGTNPQVAAARKALENGTADEKQTQLLKAVKEGQVQEFYEKPEGLGIKFSPESALKVWVGGDADDEPAVDPAAPTVDPNVPPDPPAADPAPVAQG